MFLNDQAAPQKHKSRWLPNHFKLTKNGELQNPRQEAYSIIEVLVVWIGSDGTAILQLKSSAKEKQ